MQSSKAQEGQRAESPQVLVVAHHPVLAALLGLSVELAGACPCFPEPEERVEEAMTRLKPSLVLLDADHHASGADATYRCVAEAGSRLVLFGPARRPDDLARLAERRGVQALVLPADSSTLAALAAFAVPLASADEPALVTPPTGGNGQRLENH